MHFSWQAQYLVKLECDFSWQGQYFVTFWEIGQGRSSKRRVRDDDFIVGLGSDYPRLLPTPRSRSKWWRAITFAVIVRKVESLLFCVMSVMLSLCAPCNVATSFSFDPFSNLCYLVCMFGFCIFWDWLSQPPISSITARTKTKKPKKIKQKKHKNRPNSICNYGVGLPTRYMLAARRAKKTRLKKPRIRHRHVAALKRRKAAQWKQPNRKTRTRRKIFAHTQTVPLAFPWVKPQSMQWCKDESNKNLHKQPLLTGGAGGAHATKRKRRWHTQHQNEHQNSLANTLLTVLQQWQQNLGSQRNDNEHKRKRNKPGRPDWQYQNEWNSYYSWPNLSQGQGNQPHTANDSSLAATLLDVIQQATGKCDQEVAKTIQQAIQTHLHGTDSRAPHPEYHQAGHREVSYKPSHTSNRWNKQAPVNPVHQLAPAEWTLPPRLGNYTAILEAIKQSQEIKHNIVEIQQAEHLDTLRTFWTAHECPSNITVICSGSAYHTEGSTFSTAKVTRKNQQQRIENISICALGSKDKCPWPTPSITFASKDIPKVERSTLRIAAPTEYRSGFVTKDSTFRIITDIANWKLDIPTTTQWRHMVQTVEWQSRDHCGVP